MRKEPLDPELERLAEAIARRAALKVWQKIRRMIREQQEELHQYEDQEED